VALPVSSTAIANPRRTVNQLATTRAYANYVVPLPTIPRTRKIVWSAPSLAGSRPSEAYAAQRTVTQGRITRRAPYRSTKIPIAGEQNATASAATPNALETDSRDHPNSAAIGFRKTPNVKTNRDPKLTNLRARRRKQCAIPRIASSIRYLRT
jgi:hypothetical protein